MWRLQQKPESILGRCRQNLLLARLSNVAPGASTTHFHLANEYKGHAVSAAGQRTAGAFLPVARESFERHCNWLARHSDHELPPG